MKKPMPWVDEDGGGMRRSRYRGAERTDAACKWVVAALNLLRLAYSRQAELRMTEQKLVRLNFGSSKASTSSFTVPNVVSGLWQKPS
jgi:hypothetical protein